MGKTERFVAVGCIKCRRIMVADLRYNTKTCQCGHRMKLHKTKWIRTFASANEAGEYIRKLQESKNTGFASATTLIK
ncbi:MAG TPA: DUF1922 domain-containing protein [Methanocorpusculum sp.]|nr:DUF1922 domain-containing protein [Methanocorpusculum sp.]